MADTKVNLVIALPCGVLKSTAPRRQNEGNEEFESKEQETPVQPSCTQRLAISSEAYKAFISNEIPYWYQRTLNQKKVLPNGKTITVKTPMWLTFPKQKRLELHLQRIAEHLGGKVESYKVV